MKRDVEGAVPYRHGEDCEPTVSNPNRSINPNLNPSSVGPFPSVGQRRQNRTVFARSRQQGDPFDRSTMLPPRGKVRIRVGRARESEAQRSPRRQDAARPLGGGFKVTDMGLRFRALKARKPLPSGGYLRNLLRRAGSLGLPLLVLFSSEDEKSTPKPKRLSRNNIPTIPKTFSIFFKNLATFRKKFRLYR